MLNGGETGGFGGGSLEQPRRWLGAQWAGLFLGVPSCPGPPGAPLGGAGAELGRCPGGTLTMLPRRPGAAGLLSQGALRPRSRPPPAPGRQRGRSTRRSSRCSEGPRASRAAGVHRHPTTDPRRGAPRPVRPLHRRTRRAPTSRFRGRPARPFGAAAAGLRSSRTRSVGHRAPNACRHRPGPGAPLRPTSRQPAAARLTVAATPVHLRPCRG